MKKTALIPAILIALLVGAYGAAGLLVDYISKRTLSHVRTEAPKHGAEILKLGFEDALFRLPASMYWRGLEAVVRVKKDSFLPPDKDIEFKVEKVTFALESLGKRSFRLKMAGMTFFLLERAADGGDPPVRGQNIVKGREAEIVFTLDSLAPSQAVSQGREVARQLQDLLLKGRTPLAVTFSGAASFPVNGEVIRSRVKVERLGDESVLTMDEEDVIRISRSFDLKTPLTEAEVKLVSRNPLRAYRLFQIRTRARNESRKRYRADRSVPEDAYRHVLWSYLLTKEYGENFAREVTDAHEEGRTGNTPEERQMDLANNRIGIEYARLGREEPRILELLLKDRRVIRTPGEVLP